MTDERSQPRTSNLIVRQAMRSERQGVGASALLCQIDLDRAVIGTMGHHLFPHALGTTRLEREAWWQRMPDPNIPHPSQAHSAVDVAARKLAARQAGLPFYRLFRGARSRASSSMNSLQAEA